MLGNPISFFWKRCDGSKERARCLAIQLLLLAVLPAANLADADQSRVQFCWAFGKFDNTIYFAEAEDREDRQASFEALIAISGIDGHTRHQKKGPAQITLPSHSFLPRR